MSRDNKETRQGEGSQGSPVGRAVYVIIKMSWHLCRQTKGHTAGSLRNLSKLPLHDSPNSIGSS